MRLPKRWLRYWPIPLCLALIGSGYFAWGELTRTRGNQTISFVPAKASCNTEGSLQYCAYRAAAGTNGDIVYYLHGRKLDAHIWNDTTYYTAMIQAQWQKTGALPPTVVAVSYGGTWLLTPKGARSDSGLLDDFMQRLPAIEAKLGKPKRRILLGESMGGLNVLIAGLNHPSAFTKVAALCPGVYAVSPFSKISEIRSSMERTGANPKIIFGIWLMARQYVANDAEWQTVSPLKLIDRAGPDYPVLYLSNGLYDAYGNFEGTERLARTATAHGVQVEWHPLLWRPLRHRCAILVCFPHEQNIGES
ncbi:alpha/beta hydrolase-fold protein [Asticcacaulis sp. 201]|uniref:alpha/beta hydrolase-fold protein n=1 Tax=Asticcacaulis sp. 201 TaxID=3028787 RepID=UPI002915D5E2|nr:alpha/beta hydrolase-fold protein [Asticcacaulis sp. 201]MDV6329604.1 alpha/beta hydrolase-fold protein [Asticcacaulis sp. 201]